MLGSREARMGWMRLRCISFMAKSTFSEGLYFTAKTAMSSLSTARNTPVFRFTSAGSRIFIFRMKETPPISTDSPLMVPDQPPSS